LPKHPPSFLSQDVPQNNEGWENLMQKKGLCNRNLHTFIVTSTTGVENICRHQGKYERNTRNLCRSTNKVTIYDLNKKDQTKCRYSVTEEMRYVALGCDWKGTNCFPVHYYASYENGPGNNDEQCNKTWIQNSFLVYVSALVWL
uniref:Ribonuclease A-domain domain-containing protein n=1 Tax=Lepisosteus oculatus TaxID=7918 RepID=W5LZZ0_LEPOC